MCPVQAVLERGQWAALAGLLLWAALCVYTLHRQAVATQVIGHDTVPSIVAAQKIRALLASANADLATMVLAGDSQNGPFATAFRRDINEVETVLIDASQNITYGNSEKDPITTIAQGLAQYLKGVGKARAPEQSFGAATATTFDLDALMQGTMLPSAETLDRVNFEQFDKAYQQNRSAQPILATALMLASLALVLALAWLQFRIFPLANGW